MNRLSPQEIVLGFLSTILLTTKLSWLGLGLSLITATLWVLGGSYKKSIRRFGVPLAVSLFTGVWWCMLGFIPLTLGDGFPDRRPTTADEGSALGRFVERYISSDDSIGGLITKLIPVVLLQLCWIPVYLK